MTNLLKKINNPNDLKKLKKDDLPLLAAEIRKLIIETVSKTGGHLASSLGVVELTIALHYIFDAPDDKIIWDVGHQAYTHKILTERKSKFHTLRQYKGISGFPKIEESDYDAFNTGHSGTSISAALGLAKARDTKKENHSVIAVIGDGSTTAGMAFEGFNQAGHLKSDLIVILNDNEMSISANVGAVSAYLSKILTGQLYTKLIDEIDTLLKHIPKIGNRVSRLAHRVEEAIKGILIPGRIFEDLGFNYVGPIDGHDLFHLVSALQGIKKLKGPVLFHLVTKKGKGYQPAEEKAPSFHGVSSFNIGTGTFLKKKSSKTYTEAFGDSITELAQKDIRIIAITAAMTDGTGLSKFAKKFPDRFYDVGIAEQHAATFAAALALEGLKPVVAVYSTFLQRAYDQVLHDICLMNLPVTFALDRAGIVGEDGPTHHGMFDLSYMRNLPNLVFMAPKDENELRHMLKTALEFNGPAALRYPRGSGPSVNYDKKIKPLEIGSAEVLKEGDELAIIAIGNMVSPSLNAADILSQKGIDVTVVNARFIKPLDKNLIIKLARRTKKIVTVEENVLQGGFGSAVMEMLEEEGIANIQFKRIGIPDKFIEHGSPDVLRKNYGLNEECIAETIWKHFNLSSLQAMHTEVETKTSKVLMVK
ncbi:MAG TPA: 1-deoxy-D-xylulose-5-phosphate synthase [Nitrospinota bacterium]|nr:1-deoxy-D-xylulose-5-phosphate synthase [Nitrospinota bacterium]